VMGLAGASAGALSGLVVSTWGYPSLNLLAALTTVPLVLLVSRSSDRVADRAGPGEPADPLRSAG
jgi:hypothetical protein